MRSALEWTLAMALCVGHNFIGVRSYILLDRYSGYADHFNTVGVIFALFWVALTALLLALIRPFLRLPTSTFALIYAALMVATVMPTMGFGGYFIPLLAGVFYYATPENNWRELLWDHIPALTRRPARPRDMIATSFEGCPTGCTAAVGMPGSALLFSGACSWSPSSWSASRSSPCSTTNGPAASAWSIPWP